MISTRLSRNLSEIRYLLDRYNKIAQAHFQDLPATSMPFLSWYSSPFVVDPNRISVQVEFEVEWRARHFNFEILQYYKDPYLKLRKWLEYQLWKEQYIEDDTIHGIYVVEGPVTVFEPSLFGSKPAYRPSSDPWIGPPVIKVESDLNKVPVPNFYRDGLMPSLIQEYETLKANFGEQIDIRLRQWWKGPFQLSIDMRGMEQFLMDISLRPSFACKVMEFATQAILNWASEWENYTGERYGIITLGEDSVDGNLISSETYRELVLPFHQKIAHQFESVHFHSCGNLIPLLSDIASISNLRLVHVSPWTDLKQTVDLLSGRASIYKCTHPIKDVIQASQEHREKLATEVIEASEKIPIKLLIDALPLSTNPEQPIKLVKLLRRRYLEHRREYNYQGKKIGGG